MITQIALFGYLATALAYLATAAVLALGWRGRARGWIPLLAVTGAALWGAVLVGLHAADMVLAPFVAGIDALRFAAWFALLLSMVAAVAQRHVFHLLLAVSALVAVAELALGGLLLAMPGPRGAWETAVPALGGIAGAVVGLLLVEQVYRNAGTEGRWALKYLCIGLGGIFAYDLFLFADAVLLQQADAGLWAARGYVNALVAPLVAVTAARNPDWSLDVYVSRRFVLHTATLIVVGGYLVVMALVAWSIRVYGGAWGGPVQALFLVASVLLLAILLFSGQIRAQARVFVSKHFFNYRYDYREEWLRFSRTMTAEGGEPPLRERVIRSVAQVVESPGGLLFQAGEGMLRVTAAWNVPEPDPAREPADGDLALFLAETEWVLTTREWARNPARYRGVPYPGWLDAIPRAWAVVPLLHHDALEGFVVLTRPRTGETTLDWETCDLLKIIGRQAASYLAQDEAARALSRARQFETFNRLSAFVLHDLKNIIGQLTMLARNARRHRDSPEFMADAVETIEHSVERMNQLMNQLRGGLRAGTAKVFDLNEAVQEVVAARGGELPAPSADPAPEPVWIRADRGRLVAVLGNVVQNAQEATPADGSAWVRVRRDGDAAVIEVADTGTGMSRAFVRDRLFQPFDTSKGSTGMGIGAFEAREFARELGGELEVTSTEGEGTRFRFRLPAQVVVSADAASATEAK